MRILMVASTLPASNEDRVPRFAMDQARAMADADPEVEILILAPHTPSSHRRPWPQAETPNASVVQDRFRYAPRRLERLTEAGIMPAIARRPAYLLLVPLLVLAERRALARAVKSFSPDVIYAHWFTPQAIVARGVAKRFSVPFGFTTHASDVAVWARFGALGRRLVRRVVADAAFITAVSSQTALKMFDLLRGSELARTKERAHLLPMGVDIPARPAPAGDPHHVVIIARLVEKKGIAILLAAWPLVAAAVPQARLTIAGDGPLREELQRVARDLGVDASFPGFVVGAEKEAILASAGIVAQPSIVARDGDADGLPVSVLEGLALGKIAVASDASGAQDILTDGENGYLVRAGDHESLADGLIRALTLSPSRRTSMAAAARLCAEQVSWPSIARRHLDAMRDASLES